MANKRGKVELKVYKPPENYGIPEKIDPECFVRKFKIDNIECYGVIAPGRIRRDFSFHNLPAPLELDDDIYDPDYGTHLIVGYPAGILIAEVKLYMLYTKEGYPLCRKMRYLRTHPDKYAVGCWFACIGTNLRKHRDCPDRVWGRFKKWYNQQLRIHITQPWYQISEWYWCSGLKEYTSLYLRKGRSIKIYGYVHHVVDAKDRMPCLVSKPLTPPDPWEPLWS